VDANRLKRLLELCPVTVLLPESKVIEIKLNLVLTS